MSSRFLISSLENTRSIENRESDIDEMNVTGGGTSFNAGDGMGYATPKAFKKKRKKD